MVATQTFFFSIFTPKIGEDEPNLTSIFFEMGWFNHQLVVVFHPLKCKLHKQGQLLTAHIQNGSIPNSKYDYFQVDEC